MSMPKVFVVSVLGLEGDFEAVAAFSYRNEAEDYVSRLKFCSWAIEELAVDEESVGGTHKPQPSNSPVMPNGWKLVPIEPTESMVIDGFESEPDKFFSDKNEWKAYKGMSGCQQAAHRAKLCWSAMIAAAPNPE